MFQAAPDLGDSNGLVGHGTMNELFLCFMTAVDAIMWDQNLLSVQQTYLTSTNLRDFGHDG